MANIYLAVGTKKAVVFCREDTEGIDNARLMMALGDPVTVHEIGEAHKDTPPCLLIGGEADSVPPVKPIGKEVLYL